MEKYLLCFFSLGFFFFYIFYFITGYSTTKFFLPISSLAYQRLHFSPGSLEFQYALEGFGNAI
jgi:hypothetical protein